jgi:hypothetical protein
LIGVGDFMEVVFVLTSASHELLPISCLCLQLCL